MPEVKKIKSLLTGENGAAFLHFIETAGVPYELIMTNYTMEIKCSLFHRHFMQSLRSPRCFAAFSKLKKDVKGKTPPDIDKSGLSYFEHNFKSDFFSDSVINIDLKSAYATALFNDGIITKDTYTYLSKIPKMDRLASVGMLAGKKHVFEYDNTGKCIEYEKRVAATENFFYYAVKRTAEIMGDLQLLAGADYLFTWVDGIYIRGSPGVADELCAHLKASNWGYHVETLKDFSVKIAHNKVRIEFKKPPTDKVKVFQIPAARNLFAADIIKYLTNKKQIRHEKNIPASFTRKKAL